MECFFLMLSKVRSCTCLDRARTAHFTVWQNERWRFHCFSLFYGCVQLICVKEWKGASIFMISILKNQITPAYLLNNTGRSIYILPLGKTHSMPTIQFRYWCWWCWREIYIFSKTLPSAEPKAYTQAELRFERQNNTSLWPLLSNRFGFCFRKKNCNGYRSGCIGSAYWAS